MAAQGGMAVRKYATFLFALVLGLLSVAGVGSSDKAVSIWLRDIIPFGQYPQTAKGNDKTPIEWIVLDIQDGKALLISRYGLDCQPYHKSKKSITWEKCSLRTWLNKDFLKKAFMKEEQAAILTTEVSNGRDQEVTKDQVFLLSTGEANDFFHASSGNYSSGPRVAPTDYALKKRKAYIDTFYLTSEGTPAGWWWLRQTGTAQNYTYTIQPDGGIHSDSVDKKTLVVRPALWVDLHNEVFSDYWYDSENGSSQELLARASSQSWFDDRAGSHLPMCQLQSGEELETDLYVNDDQQCDVRVYNAYEQDYLAYISLLKTCSFRIVEEGEGYTIARSPEGYEVYVTYSEGPERFLEVFIKAPTGI